jgi:hypothetical protein
MTEAHAAEPADAPAQATDEETPEANVDTIDWKAKAREWEKRAKENKSARDELEQIRESQKSDADRAADALRQAQVDAETAKAELLRYRIAASHGITDADDIALFLTGTDEDTLTRQASRLAARDADTSKPRTPRPNPDQGRATAGGQGSTAESFAEFFRKSLPS